MKVNKTIIEALNTVLKHELMAVNQYFLHARMFRNWGYGRLNDYRYHQSIRVMKEADELIERILFLEGLPNLQNLGKLLIGEDALECLKCDLKFESEIHRPALVEAVALCEAESDYVSRRLLEALLKASEEAIDWLDIQLELVGDIGIQNYLQVQIGSGDD